MCFFSYRRHRKSTVPWLRIISARRQLDDSITLRMLVADSRGNMRERMARATNEAYIYAAVIGSYPWQRDIDNIKIYISTSQVPLIDNSQTLFDAEIAKLII
jgi:hypothetical protein